MPLKHDLATPSMTFFTKHVESWLKRVENGMEQLLVASLSSVLQFLVVHLLVGFQKQFINNFVFPILACGSGFNKNNNYYYLQILYIHLITQKCFFQIQSF